MGDAKISVVVATRNRRQELLRTIRNLRSLPEQPPVIVVDNASQDGTREAVVETGDLGVSVIGLDQNLGAVARNIGVQAAGTPYVAFSDDDSWWEPGALRQAVEIFERHPGLGLLAASTVVGSARTPDPINRAFAETPLPAGPGLPGPQVLGFLACASIVRRAAFLEVGGFSPVLFFVGEERLLAYDLAAAGWDRCHLPEIVAVHEPSPNRQGSSRRRRAELRNDLLTAWLRRPLRPALGKTGRMVAGSLRDADARHALAGAARRLPAALAGRRTLPPEVERLASLIESAQAWRPVPVHERGRPS